MTDHISNEINARVHNVGDCLWHDVIENKYYFSDETYDLQGPYDTLEQADQALDKYGVWLREGSPMRKDSENH